MDVVGITALGLTDPAFPTNPKADVGVRAKATSLANSVAAARVGAESTKQLALRTGSLMTTSMISTISNRLAFCQLRNVVSSLMLSQWHWNPDLHAYNLAVVRT